MSLLTMIVASSSQGGSFGEQLNLGISYPNSLPVFDTTARGHEVTCVSNFQYAPIVYTIQDKTFFTWMQRDGAPFNNETMVVVFDHFTEKLSIAYGLGEINPPNSDNHLQGAIWPVGNKFMFLEENPHDGPIWRKFSGANYDITNIESEVNTGAGLAAYPQVQNLGSDLYYFYRRENSDEFKFAKSTDGGVNWTHKTLVTNEQSDRKGFYQFTPRRSTDGILRVFITRRNDTATSPASYPAVYYLESTDGVTFSNLPGTFSKDIVVSGSVSMAELNTNCIVFQLADPDTIDTFQATRASGGVVLDGETYFVCGDADYTGLRFIYSNSGSWVDKAIVVPGHTLRHTFNFPGGAILSNNSIYLTGTTSSLNMYAIETVGSFTQMSKFNTTDLGDNWTFVEQITSGDFNFSHIQGSWNVEEFGNGVVICGRETDAAFRDIFVHKL